MGFILGFIKKIIKLALYLCIFIGIVVLIPNLPPYTKFSSIEIAPTQERVGPLAPNGALNNAERLYVDKVLGPEAFQLVNGELYTGLSSGEIVKLSPGGHVTFVTKVGQPCTGLTQEHLCGRPLGFEIDATKNEIYVADAYLGIWKVDLKTDEKQLLVSPRVEINGRLPKLINSIALSKNGDFYWTDSTSDFSLKDGAISMLTDPSGRLFYYNAAKNQSKVLLDNLWFSNGVVVSPDNQFVVVAETCKLRLLKYYIDGPKKGKSEVFVDGLPGTPDNLRALPDGSGVLVALYTVFDNEHPLLARSLAQTPIIRKFLARLQSLIELPFQYLNTVYPHFLFDDVTYHIGHFKSVSAILPPMAGLVHIDWNGKIVASYFNTDGSLVPISDAIVWNNKLYTGAPGMQNFVGVLPAPPLLQKAFASTKTSAPKVVQNVAKEVPKAATQQTKSKPQVHEKPKVEKEIPKVAKPVAQEAKPTQPPKPIETPNAPTPKPAAQKPTGAHAPSSAPTQPPKQSEKPTAQRQPEVKPTTKQPEAKPPTKQPEVKLTTKQPETKPTTAKPEEIKSTTPKPQAKPSAPRNPVESKTNSDKRGTKPVVDSTTKNSGSSKMPNEKPALEQIPIEEEIPSDTAKPNKETLKVIKKGGPTEIPNPHP